MSEKVYGDIPDPADMTALYASLVGPLVGVYFPLPFADARTAYAALNTSRLARLWCNVYTAESVRALCIEFPGSIVLPRSFASKLDYDLPPDVFDEQEVQS